MVMCGETMKQIISILIFVLLSFSVFAASPPLPQPVVVFVTYNGEPMQDVSVLVRESKEDFKLPTLLTNEKGGIQFDLYDFKKSGIDPDKIEIKVENQVILFDVDDKDFPLKLTFELTERPCVTNCPECAQCAQCASCEVCPAEKVCDVCSACEVCEPEIVYDTSKCPKCNTEALWVVIVALILITLASIWFFVIKKK